MSSFLTPLKLEYVDGRTWKVDAPFRYDVGAEDSGESIVVPAGTLTDFASIPRFFWRLLPPTGEYGKAAVIHDWLYQNLGIIQQHLAYDVSPRLREYTRKQCDDIFLDAMSVLGVPAWKKRAMHGAVRAFGWSAWNSHRQRLSVVRSYPSGNVVCVIPNEQENPTQQ